MCVCSVAQSCPTLCDPMETVAHQAPLSMEFFRQEYCSWLPFSTPGSLPDPRIEPASFVSLVLVGRFFPLSHMGSPKFKVIVRTLEDITENQIEFLRMKTTKSEI